MQKAHNKTLNDFLKKFFLSILYIISSKSILKPNTKKVNVGAFGWKKTTLLTIDEFAHTFPYNITCPTFVNVS